MINILLNLYNFHESWCYEKLKNIISDSHKVLIIPFSFHDDWMTNKDEWEKAYNKDDGKYYDDVVNPFLSYNISEKNIKWLNYFNDDSEIAKKNIQESDILFFTGGLPDRMMDRLREFKIIEEIEEFKGIVMGSSAGAMIQLENYHITPDKDYDVFSYEKGLNIISDFYIEVHYNNTDLQNNSIKKVLNEKVKRVYAMKDTGGLLINKGEIVLLGDVEVFENIPYSVFIKTKKY
ncbi:peptidase S51 [Romboutsia weinsteinii]|uniref:Peptidase S51 n=1 Tax=Romboutsia weinsteinii TaxID=2020949 RepID=A0A371J6B2_9FIRM|nr:Type 1 glutamine amidotransferase-like domain-containing protein [Romboutsia weinsteinii]RDY28233.1 peptidase S51 [Romboutsia weinsteinii]